jgi:uncharacterized protein YcfL
MKKLLLILLVFGCIACSKKEEPAVEESMETMMDTTVVADSAMADTSGME